MEERHNAWVTCAYYADDPVRGSRGRHLLRSRFQGSSPGRLTWWVHFAVAFPTCNLSSARTVRTGDRTELILFPSFCFLAFLSSLSKCYVAFAYLLCMLSLFQPFFIPLCVSSQLVAFLLLFLVLTALDYWVLWFGLLRVCFFSFSLFFWY